MRVGSIIILCMFFSCENSGRKVQAEKGGIDIITNVYFNASQGLDSVKSYHVSKMNYQGNEIIELVPDLDYPQFISQVYFIKDTLCFTMGNLDEAKGLIAREEKKEWFSVYKKQSGTVFLKGKIPLYSKRKNIADTVLLNKTYKRFEIDSEESFTRYYIYETDTILPYSFNNQIDLDYSGRLERMDSYNKNQDIFVTVQLLHRSEIDEDAQDLIDFKKFVNKKRNASR